MPTGRAMSPQFFEGPEKKVELAVIDGYPSLRSRELEFWYGVVRAAGADVLSVMRTDAIDAYLLSESSLFVYDELVTMITCGQTALVAAIEAMLEAIEPDAISTLVYERKNEHLPRQQPTSFVEDARRLALLVPGRAVRFGHGREHAVRMFHTTREYHPATDARTLEILMHGIGPERAARFRGLDSGANIARGLGLSRALEGHRLDEHVFAPAGYSLNAVRGTAYTTLHVTPQHVGSYVSFETNTPEFVDDLSGLVNEVVHAFQPEAFDVVVFEPTDAQMSVEVPGYARREHQREPLSGYHVTFQHFSRPSSSPGRALPIPLE